MMNHRISYDTFSVRDTRSKMDILIERAAFLESEAASIRATIEGLKGTPFGRPCTGCGTLLATEADFEAHFIVKDENYLNLGRCPEKD